MNEQIHIPKEALARAYGQIQSVIDNIETVIVGKHECVELVVLALLARGHVLIEDVPGVGKTSLVSALAKSVDCGFRRIQFTPDLMPSDVTGFSVYNQKSGEFEFRAGGVMSNLVLADEINRASAKTQASLLEAMQERQVTVDSHTYTLEEPFMVLATQNPLESFGTYPLPDAQIDRFLLKLSMGYPSIEEERRIIHDGRASKKSIRPVISREDVVQLSAAADSVFVDESVERYIVEITAATRTHAGITLGVSPRGSIALYSASKALALMRGRDYVLPDDIKYLTPSVLAHRITLSSEAKLNHTRPEALIAEIVDGIAIPV
ncbi:MAG: MoxR family ATPase [Oscillospiraceae bacterium]|nr:MoxR family ATPase [Oscillospiraceae bacterium]